MHFPSIHGRPDSFVSAIALVHMLEMSRKGDSNMNTNTNIDMNAIIIIHIAMHVKVNI